MYLNASGLMGIKNNSFSKFDRLEQQLGRPAVIPWVETGDPLTHLYQKEVNSIAGDVMITKKKCVECSNFFLFSSAT